MAARRAATGPRGRGHASARVRGHGPARTRFLLRPRVIPRPRVTADVGGRPDDVRGRPDEKDVRTEIFIQKRPL
jgi:hypothetical protein